MWAPVVLTLADALSRVRRQPPLAPRRDSFTTVDCSANFISSAKEGNEIIATASPLHTGRTTQVWDATVTDVTTERLMASYRCTQLILY